MALTPIVHRTYGPELVGLIRQCQVPSLRDEDVFRRNWVQSSIIGGHLAHVHIIVSTRIGRYKFTFGIQ